RQDDAGRPKGVQNAEPEGSLPAFLRSGFRGRARRERRRACLSGLVLRDSERKGCGMTQEEADLLALGRLVRDGIKKALPLDYSKAVEKYITVDLEGFGVVLVKIEVLGTQKETQH